MNTSADTVRLAIGEATALLEEKVRKVGYSAGEAVVIAANLLDAEMCGYPALGFARLLTIAADPRTRLPRSPVRITRETPSSALIDAGNYVGVYALQRAAEVAIDKAKASGLAIVGMHNSYLSGRNARYLEIIARAGLAGIHVASSEPFVVAPGGKIPVVGTNPIAIAVPGDPHPVIFDMGTSVITHGEVVMAARLGQSLPAGTVLDREGAPTCDAAAALEGGILPLAGHKGFGLSLMIQSLCLMAGAALPSAHVKGYGFVFIVFRPDLLVPAEVFQEQLAQLLEGVRTSGRQPDAGLLRIPSERAFRQRDRALAEGLFIKRDVLERVRAL